jgi:hypothetical protein
VAIFADRSARRPPVASLIMQSMRSGGAKHALVVLLSLGSGCAVPITAVVDGKVVSRPTLAYADGKYFRLVHQGVHPGAVSPGSGVYSDGGRITGRVCGVDLVYDVWHAGSTDVVTGFATDAWNSTVNHPVKLTIDEQDGVRRFAGVAGRTRIDLELSSDHLAGTIRLPFYDRRYELRAAGDDLVGHTAVAGAVTSDGVPIRVRGRAALWAMPAAAQVALLAPMLTCAYASSSASVNGPPVGVIDLRHRVGSAGKQDPESDDDDDEPGFTAAPAAPEPAPQAAQREYERLSIGYRTTVGQVGVAGAGMNTWQSLAFYQGVPLERRWFSDPYDLYLAMGDDAAADRYRLRHIERLVLVIGGVVAAAAGAALTVVAMYTESQPKGYCLHPNKEGTCDDGWAEAPTGPKVELGLGVGLLVAGIVTTLVGNYLPGSYLSIPDSIAAVDGYNARLRRRLGLSASLEPHRASLDMIVRF